MSGVSGGSSGSGLRQYGGVRLTVSDDEEDSETDTGSSDTETESSGGCVICPAYTHSSQ